MRFPFYTAVLTACSIFCFSFRAAQDPLKASMERGKKVYESTCLPCHQSKGSGVPGMNPPLIKTKYVLGESDTLINILLNGLDEEVAINGQTYSNPMPAQPQLKNKEIADVLTYVRNSFGNSAPAVTVKDVNKLRSK
jgi:mono/diheme cytochrome c family protein